MTVAKSKGRQRLVWDMRQANAGFLPAPYARLGSVGALASLELGESGFFAAAATDVPNFFYSLRMPKGFEQYVVLDGVDVAYVRGLLQAQGGCGVEWPEGADALGCCCLPMGFSWAPFLAQRVLEFVVDQAGLAGETELYHGCGAVPLKKWATLCYLDDFTVIVKRATRAAARAEADTLLGRFKRELEQKGLGSHKDQSGEVLVSLGVVVDCRDGEITLRPRPDKFATLLEATREVLRSRSVHARTLQRLLGHWVWWLQLRRPLYSVLHAIYPLLSESGVCGRIRLPEEVKRELQLLVWLAPTVRCSLAWPVAQQIHMVDAGPSLGAVVYSELESPPAFSGEVEPPPRHQWRLAIKRPWAHQEHNNLGEGRTVLWAVARCARAGMRRRVAVVFSDSQVVIGAFDKGRSSSPSLNQLCRRYAALCVAFQLKCVLKYVPSALNWADGPSRGYLFPCVAPETRAKHVPSPPDPSPGGPALA